MYIPNQTPTPLVHALVPEQHALAAERREARAVEPPSFPLPPAVVPMPVVTAVDEDPVLEVEDASE